MAKITYIGESDSIEWRGQAFVKGKTVTTDNAELLAAAQRNRFFKTEAMVDKQTKAEIKAEEKARQDALAQAEADAAEEARRVLALNAGDTSSDASDEGAEDTDPDAAGTAPARRGRPPSRG